jgi:2-desacetyl-2-hydroxyethyl bacteriochlorophyllide A dehydrogenase
MTKVLGQDLNVLKNQLLALVMNVVSWILSFVPSSMKYSLPIVKKGENCAISIDGPGGLDRLQLKSLIKKNDEHFNEQASVGYNVPGYKCPYANLPKDLSNLPSDLVLVNVKYFSLNYADVTIRWGLYESALRFVGWPIIPGFDFSGVVIHAGKDTKFNKGDDVFGFTMFGAYSSSLLVPGRQLRTIPQNLTMEIASGIPAVAATALHSISLAGGFPNKLITANKAALVHSASGGVGSMLIQMLKLCGYSPIVGVVGSKHKVKHCLAMGADHCIDKSNCNLWNEVKKISPDGYTAIFDANGIETTSESYEHLTQCGKLILYGFHSNLPKASSLLSPLAWLGMIYKTLVMPKFEPMDLVTSNKSVCGFNLSFFSGEHALIELYLETIEQWFGDNLIHLSPPTVFEMKNIDQAHNLIQSGSSIGKIVMSVPEIYKNE